MSHATDALRRSFLTAGLSDAEIDWLAGRTQRRHIAEGAIVFEEGEPGNALFVVESGEIRITVASPTGQPLTLDTLYAGDSFGGLALLDGEPRSATATAIQASTLFALHRDDFMQLIHTERTALDAVLGNLAQMVRSMNHKLADAVQLSAAGLVAKVMLEMAERHGESTGGHGTLIKHPLSVADIASMTGLYGSEVERVLETYQYEFVLERGPEYWTVLRPDVLDDASANGLRRGD